MPVSNKHPEYLYHSDMWVTTRDACSGDKAVKDKPERYLPAGFRLSDPERYAVYSDRAYFLDVTGRTEAGMVGMVFRKPPTYSVPTQIEELFGNIDGAGNSLEQVAKDGLQGMLETRRHLFLANYPTVESGTDAETIRIRGIRPYCVQYSAESLINWAFSAFDGQRKLSLAVLAEDVKDDDDEFSHKTKKEYLVLRLSGGVYTQQRYDQEDNPITDELIVRANGQPMRYIPLFGVRELATPPLYGIAKTNIAHYRNTADLEDAAYVVGQPMVHVNTGDTPVQEWKKANGDIQFGSRKGIVSQKGSLEIVQANENNLVREVKKDKIEEMSMLGAQLIQRGGQAETAEAARLDASAEASVLDTLTNDLSEDIEAMLKAMADFAGVPSADIEYKLNTDFWEAGLSPQALSTVVAARQAGVIASADVLHMIRNGRIAIDDGRTDEEIALDVANETAATLTDG